MANSYLSSDHSEEGQLLTVRVASCSSADIESRGLNVHHREGGHREGEHLRVLRRHLCVSQIFSIQVSVHEMNPVWGKTNKSGVNCWKNANGRHRQADIQGYPTVRGIPSTTKATVNGARNKCRNWLKSQQQRQAKRCSTNDACRF